MGLVINASHQQVEIRSGISCFVATKTVTIFLLLFVRAWQRYHLLRLQVDFFGVDRGQGICHNRMGFMRSQGGGVRIAGTGTTQALGESVCGSVGS